MWTVRKNLGFDLETDGINPLEARPVSFALARFHGSHLVTTRHGLVNPERPIPPEVSLIHGINDEMVQERGGDLKKSVVGIAHEMFEAEAAEIPIVGMNLRFDLTIIDTLYKKFQGKSLREDGWNGFVIDIKILDRKLDKYRSGKRTLKDLCVTYGINTGASHTAADDAIAATRVALAIAEKYPWIKNTDLDMLMVQQRAWHAAWVDDFNEYREKKGEEPIPLSEKNWPLCTDERITV